MGAKKPHGVFFTKIFSQKGYDFLLLIYQRVNLEWWFANYSYTFTQPS
jgi:hypothetical protein